MNIISFFSALELPIGYANFTLIIKLLHYLLLLADDVSSIDTPRNPRKKFVNQVIDFVVYFFLKLLACIFFFAPGLGRFSEAQDSNPQVGNLSNREMAGSGSLENGTLTEAKEETLHPCWQRLQNLESLVTDLCNKPTNIPPEKEDMLLESLSRIKSIEQDLQRTKKVRLLSAINVYCNQFLYRCMFLLSVNWI